MSSFFVNGLSGKLGGSMFLLRTSLNFSTAHSVNWSSDSYNKELAYTPNIYIYILCKYLFQGYKVSWYLQSNMYHEISTALDEYPVHSLWDSRIMSRGYRYQNCNKDGLDYKGIFPVERYASYLAAYSSCALFMIFNYVIL